MDAVLRWRTYSCYRGGVLLTVVLCQASDRGFFLTATFFGVECVRQLVLIQFWMSYLMFKGLRGMEALTGESGGGCSLQGTFVSVSSVVSRVT